MDTRTGTLAVQLEVANPQRLLHGQFATDATNILHQVGEYTPPWILD